MIQHIREPQELEFEFIEIPCRHGEQRGEVGYNELPNLPRSIYMNELHTILVYELSIVEIKISRGRVLKIIGKPSRYACVESNWRVFGNKLTTPVVSNGFIPLI